MPATLKHPLAVALCALVLPLVLASCSSTPASYQQAAIDASQSGDQKTAVSMAKKEVERFAKPDQCSRTVHFNCGTLALAYGGLAEYQIMEGDRLGGEESFSRAKGALEWTDTANRPSATGMVYRDVSEAYWKTGDRARAIAVFNEGRAAGADGWLAMGSAAKAAMAENAPK
jgi:hypothetical protein